MRRQTNTINWGRELPLAQGIRFGEKYIPRQASPLPPNSRRIGHNPPVLDLPEDDMDLGLEGKRAIVTGGSLGIGKPSRGSWRVKA